MGDLLTPRAFADLHDISYEATNTFIHSHRSNSFVKVINGKTMLDNRELEFRLTTRKTIRQLAHDIYYQILQLGETDYDQAKALSRIVGGSITTWASYMTQGLFRLSDDRITQIDHPQKLVQYVKAGHAMLKVLLRHEYKYEGKQL